MLERIRAPTVRSLPPASVQQIFPPDPRRPVIRLSNRNHTVEPAPMDRCASCVFVCAHPIYDFRLKNNVSVGNIFCRIPTGCIALFRIGGQCRRKLLCGSKQQSLEKVFNSKIRVIICIYICIYIYIYICSARHFLVFLKLLSQGGGLHGCTSKYKETSFRNAFCWKMVCDMCCGMVVRNMPTKPMLLDDGS